MHAAFEYGSIGLGVASYRRARRKLGLPALSAPGSFAVFVGLLVGAGLGNKLVFAFERPDQIAAWWAGGAYPAGQSIVGGLLGGLIGVETAKRLTRQPASTGDPMVSPLLFGMSLGRLGCWLAGVHDDTYGLPTTLPWGLDAGDGVERHPIPLYELVFLGLLAVLLHLGRRPLALVEGLRFKVFLAAYLVWRFAIDALKPVHFVYPGGLSGIRWIAAIGVALYLPSLARAIAARPTGERPWTSSAP